MMKQALERLVALDDRWGLPHVLDGFVVLAAAQGQPDSALRLGAASLTLREAIGAPLDPSFVVYRERSLAAVRRASGPGPAAAAWAAGRAMSAEQTIAAALAVATGGLRQPKASHSSATGRRPDELTARENEVARLVALGMSNQQIAGTLVISERTVESHVGNILDKLGLSARTQIVAWVDAHH